MGCGSSKGVVAVVDGSSRNNSISSRNTRTASNGNNKTEIAVFGLNDADTPADPVDNAKPRLRSGIRRTGNPHQGPITPVIGTQEELTPRQISIGRESFGDAKEIEVFRIDDDTIPANSTESSKPNFQTAKRRHSTNGPVTQSSESHQMILLTPPTTNADCLSLDSHPNSLKPIHDHSASSSSLHLQASDNKDDHLPFNTSRTNLSGSRASSAKTGSILTTTALNTSIVTSFDGEDFHSELALRTPNTSMTDYEISTFRTLSITPSVHASVDATPIALHDKSFGPIIEEYEGGFTPRSIQNGDARGYVDPSRKFTPREVFQHNHYMGRAEWSIYKGKVYDNRLITEVFRPLVHMIRERREAEKLERKKQKDAEKEQKLMENQDSDFEDSYSDCSYDSEVSFTDADLNNIWRRGVNGVRYVMWSGLDRKAVEQHLPPCCVGTLVLPSDKGFWDDIRNDVKRLLDELNHEDAKDALSAYMAEYLHLLQRWINKYRVLYPKLPDPPQGDPNQNSFPLPEEIGENPDCLRAWVDNWESFDFDIPENGAWSVIEVEDIDLGDPQEIFAATLKSHVDLTPLDTEISGEAGWNVIHEGLFADDVMTEEQKITEQRRKERTDLFDPTRMKRRRQRILRYFITKYEFNRSQVEHFLNWADEMEKGEKKFLSLC